MDLMTLRQKALEDLKLTDELDRDAQDLPRRKAQWSEWLTVFSVEYKRQWFKLNAKKKEKFDYYITGQNNVILDRRDIIDYYLPGDDAIQEIQKQMEGAHQKIELCERTLKALNSMGFDIKNVIEFRKLMSGIV